MNKSKQDAENQQEREKGVEYMQILTISTGFLEMLKRFEFEVFIILKIAAKEITMVQANVSKALDSL